MEQEKNQISEKEETSEISVDQEKKKKREAYFEMALFLILGILIGITVKTEAVKKITIGFDDYKLSKNVQSYDIDQIKNQIDAKIAQQQAEAQAQQQIQVQQIQSQSQPVQK